MKDNGTYFLGVCILLAAGIVSILHAQSVASFGASGIGPIAPTVAQCPVYAASSSSPIAALCPVGSGTTFQLYVSYNGGPYAPLSAAGGVTSFNGRTGAVVSASGDYTATQVTGSNVVSSVFGRTGAVVAAGGDYVASQVTNSVSSASGSTYPLSCPSAQISTGASGTLTASSCQF